MSVTSSGHEHDHEYEYEYVVDRCEDVNDDMIDDGQGREAYQKAMLAKLIHQLDLSFYSFCYLSYLIDHKTIVFALRAISQLQFSQPRQIQPDRSLKFFTILSLAISLLTLFHHLLVPTTPAGVLLDFIGSSKLHPPRSSRLLHTLALISLDGLSGSSQLLLVLLTFTQAHQIPLHSLLASPPAPPPNSSSSHLVPPPDAHPDSDHQDLLEQGQLLPLPAVRQEVAVALSSSLFTLQLSNLLNILFSVQVPVHSPSASSPTPQDDQDSSSRADTQHRLDTMSIYDLNLASRTRSVQGST